MFTSFNPDLFDFTANPGPISASLQPAAVVTIGTSNFKLMPTSQTIGKGKIDFTPVAAVTTTGTYGTTITPPGKDIGAYQSDGTGNQH